MQKTKGSIHKRAHKSTLCRQIFKFLSLISKKLVQFPVKVLVFLLPAIHFGIIYYERIGDDPATPSHHQSNKLTNSPHDHQSNKLTDVGLVPRKHSDKCRSVT